MADANQRPYGPAAASSRALLRPEYWDLFDWSTAQLVDPESAIRFGSVLQAVACRLPDSSYWRVIELARQVMEAEGFEKRIAAAEIQADKELAKPMD